MIAEPKSKMEVLAHNRVLPSGKQARSPMQVEPGMSYRVLSRVRVANEIIVELDDPWHSGCRWFALEKDFEMSGKEVPIGGIK